MIVPCSYDIGIDLDSVILILIEFIQLNWF